MPSVIGNTLGSPPWTASTSYPKSSRPCTGRPRTSLSTYAELDSQHVICAISESRGVAPIVGLAFLNLDTSEAILCQISDTQTYVRSMQKLQLRSPTQVLMVAPASGHVSYSSKLPAVLEESMENLNCTLVHVDRRYFAESQGVDYLNQLASPYDVEAIKSAITGNYYAVCCFAAVGPHFSKSPFRLLTASCSGPSICQRTTFQEFRPSLLAHQV